MSFKNSLHGISWMSRTTSKFCLFNSNNWKFSFILYVIFKKCAIFSATIEYLRLHVTSYGPRNCNIWNRVRDHSMTSRILPVRGNDGNKWVFLTTKNVRKSTGSGHPEYGDTSRHFESVVLQPLSSKHQVSMLCVFYQKFSFSISFSSFFHTIMFFFL